MEDSMDKYLKEHKKRYQEYLDFLEVEKQKGEGVSKKVQAILYKKLESNLFIEKTVKMPLDKYSSGRKKSPFDEWGMFIECEMTDNSEIAKPIFFCKEEIQSYSKSYRIFRPKTVSIFSQFDENFVKVFEFKSEKI